MNHLVFSKDRPMQLTAYLDSFGHNAYERSINSMTLVPEHFEEKYGNNFDWKFTQPFVEANGFDRSLELMIDNGFVSRDHKYILFGCDDVVFVDELHLDTAQEFLDEHNDVLGFSFRLGTNTKPKIPGMTVANNIVAWDWRHKPSHWGYPFELMATIYRTEDFIRIFSERKHAFKTPNCLESFGNHWMFANPNFRRHMACFRGISRAYAQDVNRVQDVFQNRIQGTDGHTAEKLIERYNTGNRIDWMSMQGISYDEPFLGHKFWKETNGTG